MTLQIPLLNTARQSFEITLSGQLIRMFVWWQPSDKYWYATIQFPVGEYLVSGRRIVLDSGIIKPVPTEFIGDFYCRSLLNNNDEPLFNPWGITHQLVYER